VAAAPATASVTAYVINSGAGTITPITTTTKVAGAAITVGSDPVAMAFTPNGATGYVVNAGSGTVTPVTTATGAAGPAIGVGDGPAAMAITPNGKTAYVADEDSAEVTPITTATNTAKPPITVGSGPDAIVITPDGKTAYVASKGTGTVTPITVATSKAGPPITITPDSFEPLLLGMTRDGSTVYAAGGGAFDAISTATNTVTDSLTGVVATDLAVTPDGTAAFTTGPLDITPINLVTGTAGALFRFGVPGSGSVNGLSVSPDSKTVWTTVSDNNVNSVVALSTASDAEAGSAPLPSHGINVAVSPDGTTAYVVLGNSVIPVSTSNFTAGPAIPAGSGASAIVFAPAPAPTGSGPVFTSGTTDTAVFGQAFSFTVTATGQPSPTISRSGTLPPGVKFTHSSGQAVLSGTPDGNAAGVYPVTFTAVSKAGTTTQAFTLTILRPPAIGPLPFIRGTEGVALTATITTSGYPAPALRKTGQMPAGLTFTDNGDGTATIAGIPAAGSRGRYPVTVTATSAEGTASRVYTILVSR
jgi:DNA-binding beta-propeller fold protein YncE